MLEKIKDKLPGMGKKDKEAKARPSIEIEMEDEEEGEGMPPEGDEEEELMAFVPASGDSIADQLTSNVQSSFEAGGFEIAEGLDEIDDLDDLD